MKVRNNSAFVVSIFHGTIFAAAVVNTVHALGHPTWAIPLGLWAWLAFGAICFAWAARGDTP